MFLPYPDWIQRMKRARSFEAGKGRSTDVRWLDIEFTELENDALVAEHAPGAIC
jgi:hypothetical protein